MGPLGPRIRQWHSFLPLTQIEVKVRPVSGSQPTFSLNPNPDENKEAASCIYILVYCVLSFFYVLLNFVLNVPRISIKMSKILWYLSIFRNPGPAA